MYIVTGGLGFIGSHLVNALLDDGHEVVVIDDLSAGRPSTVARKSTINGAWIIRAGDISEVKFKDCSGVFHLAASVAVADSMQHPYSTTLSTYMDGVSVMEKAARHGVRVVFPSSAAVYGLREGVCREDMPASPVSPYGAAKYGLEVMAQTIPNLSYAALRLFNVYGAGQNSSSPYSGVISKFVTCRDTGAQPVLFGDGTQSRDFVHVSDVVRCMILSMMVSENFVVNVGTGVSVSVSEALTQIYQAAGNTVKPLYGDFRAGDILHSCADTNALETRLGISCKISFADGLKLFDKP